MKKTTLFAILLLLIMTGKSFASSCLTNLKLNKEMKTLNLNDFEITEIFLLLIQKITIRHRKICQNFLKIKQDNYLASKASGS